MRWRDALAVLWSAMAILAVGPSILSAQILPSPSPQILPSTARREVRIGIAGVPAAVDPTSALDGSVPLIARQVYDTLVSYREGSTDIGPALATRWTVSRDGLEWSFTLREGVRFHDGTALTAAEVAASFERQRTAEPQHPSPVWSALMRGTPGVVKEVRAADARTVQFVLLQPYAPLLTLLAHPGLGIVRQASGPDGTARLVASGPYRLGEASAGRLVLEAVPGHWTGAPRAERLVFLEVNSDDHAEAELAAGGVDIWIPPGPPRRTDWALSVPGTRVGYLAFQTEKEPFSRKKIRQAVAAALDPAVLGVALGRTAVPLQSFLPPGVWARREGSAVLGGTRQTVARLLDEGGWPRGYSPALLVPQDLAGLDVALLADAIQLTLEAANIRVRVRMEPEAVARAALAIGDHDLALTEAGVIGGDPHLFLYPLSTSEGASRGPRMTNYSFFRNARLDDVLIRASQLAFRPERQRLYQRAQAMLAEDLPWLPLYVRLVWAVARPDVRGLRLHPTGYHRLTTVGIEGG
jgi:peptide/nickel transport system substrate-binding protein